MFKELLFRLKEWFFPKKVPSGPGIELNNLSENLEKLGNSVLSDSPEDAVFAAMKYCGSAKANVSKILENDIDQEVSVKLAKIASGLSQVYNNLDFISDAIDPESMDNTDARVLFSKQKHKVEELRSEFRSIKL